MADAEPLPIGLCTQLACIFEATARKPGNVHRHADFADTTYLDFLLSAAAIAPVMDRAPGRPVGETVLEAVRATRQVVSSNTNLGTILLLAPLAAVPDGQPLKHGVYRVLRDLTLDDSRAVFEAIRLAQPGGLGQVGEQDVAGEPTLPLRQVMELAAERDSVAEQYVTDFRAVFTATELLEKSFDNRQADQELVIILGQLAILTAKPGSLIVRKCGPEVAAEASQRAAELVEQLGEPGRDFRDDLAGFDAWLRAEGHRRNPGTTADLLTASLFVALRRGIIPLPLSPPFASALPSR
jgi:triphosphoribosyl-dephospho-CoA synthase